MALSKGGSPTTSWRISPGVCICIKSVFNLSVYAARIKEMRKFREVFDNFVYFYYYNDFKKY